MRYLVALLLVGCGPGYLIQPGVYDVEFRDTIESWSDSYDEHNRTVWLIEGLNNSQYVLDTSDADVYGEQVGSVVRFHQESFEDGCDELNRLTVTLYPTRFGTYEFCGLVEVVSACPGLLATSRVFGEAKWDDRIGYDDMLPLQCEDIW
jgi:hypothetical protein